MNFILCAGKKYVFQKKFTRKKMMRAEETVGTGVHIVM